LGALASSSAFQAIDSIAASITAAQANGLLEKIRNGMTPPEVEAIFARPPETRQRLQCSQGDNDLGCLACEGDDCDVHYKWTVRGHQTGVIFARGQFVRGRYVWRDPEPLGKPGPVRRFAGWFFFWWAPDGD